MDIKKAVSVPYAEILEDDNIHVGVAEHEGKYGMNLFIPFSGVTPHQVKEVIKRNQEIIKYYSGILPKRKKSKPGTKEIIPAVYIWAMHKHFGRTIKELCTFLENAYGDSPLRDKINYDSVRTAINRQEKLFLKTKQLVAK